MSLRDRIRNRVADAIAVPPPPLPVAPLPSDARADADLGGAAIANPISGLGMAGDSGASARPVPRYDLSPEELIDAYKGTLYQRLCKLTPQWATKKGFRVTDDTDDDAPLAKPLKRLKVMDRFRKADTWGAALGESRILIVTDDPTPWSEPLLPRNITRVKGLEVFDRREFTVRTYNEDIDAGDLGWPETYNIHPRRPVTFPSDVIHESRLLRFYGNDLPPSELGYGRSGFGWGADALGQVLWDSIRNLSQMGAAGAHIAQQLSIAVFHIDAIKAKTGGDDREATHAKYRALGRMMSVMRAVFLGKHEKMERVSANPTGFGELSEGARLELSATTGKPLTLVFGTSPEGFNTDGASWQEIWYGDVAAHQEERYRDPLEYLIKLLYLTEGGGIPDVWALEFNALQELTRKEKAEARLLETQADGNQIADGVLKPSDTYPRYTVPGGYGGLQPLPEAPEEEVAETAPPRIGEINAAVDLGKAITEGSLNREQVLAIAIGSLRLPPDQAAALASGVPQTEPAPDRADDVDTRNRARGPGTKQGAREALNRAIQRGDLERPSKCPKCGKGGQIEAHHKDYSKPTDVMWMCSQCHSDYHKKADASDPTSACVLIPLSEAAKARWLSVVAMAEVIVGPLEREDYPHVTAHFVGPIPDGPALDLEHLVEVASKEFGAIDARPVRVGALGDTARPAIVLHLGGWGIEALPNTLSRRAGYLSSTPPHDEYRPHVNLGYLDRELTTEELTGLADIPLPKEWTLALAVLQLSRGGHVKSYPLTGSRRDSDD